MHVYTATTRFSPTANVRSRRRIQASHELAHAVRLKHSLSKRRGTMRKERYAMYSNDFHGIHNSRTPNIPQNDELQCVTSDASVAGVEVTWWTLTR